MASRNAASLKSGELDRETRIKALCIDMGLRGRAEGRARISRREDGWLCCQARSRNWIEVGSGRGAPVEANIVTGFQSRRRQADRGRRKRQARFRRKDSRVEAEEIEADGRNPDVFDQNDAALAFVFVYVRVQKQSCRMQGNVWQGWDGMGTARNATQCNGEGQEMYTVWW